MKRKDLAVVNFTRHAPGYRSRRTRRGYKVPLSDIVIVHLDGDDPVRGNKLFAASDDPHDVWFKERAGSILGIDFNQPVPAVELALEYQGELT